MAPQVDLTSSIVRTVELALGRALYHPRREPRASNDNKFVIGLSGKSEPYVLSLFPYTTLESRRESTQRVLFFHVLGEIIERQELDTELTRPFPEFIAFEDGNGGSPFVDISNRNANLIVTINRLIKAKNGASDNIQEVIDRDETTLTAKLAQRAGEFLGNVHRHSIENSYALPSGPAIGLLDIVSSQLTTYRAGIIQRSGRDAYNAFESEYRELNTWRHALTRSARARGCWCLLDYYPVNTIDSDRGLCFVDFGTAGIADPLQDLAMSVDAWCSRFDTPDMSLVRQFLLGYRRKCGLVKPEAALLYKLVRLSILRWGVNRAVNRIESATWRTLSDPAQNISKLLKWKEHQSVFESVLLQIV